MIVGRFDSRASSTAQFTATVVVPAPPLAPRNTCVTHGCLVPAEVASRRAAIRRTAPWNDSSIARDGLVWPPGVQAEELVGAGAHRLEDQVGLGGRRDREDGDGAVAGAHALDGRHSRRRVGADVDDEDVGRGASDAALDDHHRNPAGAQQPCDLPFELFVVADDGCCKLCHGTLLTLPKWL